MLADASTLAVTAAATKNVSIPPLIIAGGIFLLGGPAVHCVHGKVGTAFGSLGLRIFIPAVGAAVGLALNSYSGEDRALGSAVYGGIVGGVGALVAMILDWTLLAREMIDEPPSGDSNPSTLSLALGRNGLRVMGQF